MALLSRHRGVIHFVLFFSFMFFFIVQAGLVPAIVIPPEEELLTFERMYVYGQGLVAKKDGNGVLYTHQDYLSSNRFTTDGNGKLSSKNVQDPYGKDVEEYGYKNPLEFDYKYTGKEEDDYLYYYGARYYQPSTMRFISTDPVSGTGSLYGYAASNPLKYVDPDGNNPVAVAQALSSLAGSPVAQEITAGVIEGLSVAVPLGISVIIAQPQPAPAVTTPSYYPGGGFAAADQTGVALPTSAAYTMEGEQSLEYDELDSYVQGTSMTPYCFCITADEMVDTMDAGTNIEHFNIVADGEELSDLPEAGIGTITGPVLVFRDPFSAMAYKHFFESRIWEGRLDIAKLQDPSGVLYLNANGMAQVYPLAPRGMGSLPQGVAGVAGFLNIGSPNINIAPEERILGYPLSHITPSSQEEALRLYLIGQQRNRDMGR